MDEVTGIMLPNIAKPTAGILTGLLNKPCCMQRAGEYRSLTLGFGERVPTQRKKSGNEFRGEWELGTYNSAWRVVADEKIICGSMTPIDSNSELELAVQGVRFGGISAIRMLSKFDISIKMDNGLTIDFLCASNDDDELFFIFGPDHFCMQYHLNFGWRTGKSNEPWKWE